ncbi:MAG: outer membrane protein OmpA-like peptidoglycan-associated protein [Alphaproteobacteria bacterium]|jgi:outer membrane protein OmpA-like peptidoglycan-associated protein
MNKFRLTTLSGALILGTLASATIVNAQNRYNLYSPGSSRPSVIVDLTVLDKLGPEPTLPGLLRPRTPVAPAPVRTSSQYLGGNQARLLHPPTEPPRSNVTLPADIRQATAARPTINAPVMNAPTMNAPAAPPSMAKPAQSTQSITAPKLVRRATPVRKAAVAIPTPPPIAAPRITAPKITTPKPAPAKIAQPKVIAKAPRVVKRPTSKVAALIPPAPRITPPPPAPKIVARPSVPRANIPKAPRIPVAAPKITTPKVAAAPKRAPAKITAPKTPAKRSSVPPPPALKKPTRTQVALVGPATLTGADGTLQIRFAPKSPDLPNKAESVLSSLAKKLNDDPGLRVQLHGYATGPIESPSQARRLSLLRALSVRTFLMKKGVRSTRIDVRALGSKEDGGPKDRVDVLFPRS